MRTCSPRNYTNWSEKQSFRKTSFLFLENKLIFRKLILKKFYNSPKSIK